MVNFFIMLGIVVIMVPLTWEGISTSFLVISTVFITVGIFWGVWKIRVWFINRD